MTKLYNTQKGWTSRTGPFLLQLDAGAEVVLTQPPLAWEAFRSWWEAIERCFLGRPSLSNSLCLLKTLMPAEILS